MPSALTIPSRPREPCLQNRLALTDPEQQVVSGEWWQYVLTDVVIKTEQCARELCSLVSHLRLHCRVRLPPGQGWSWLPLSPFITTQIFEPTHLSISSGPIRYNVSFVCHCPAYGVRNGDKPRGSSWDAMLIFYARVRDRLRHLLCSVPGRRYQCFHLNVSLNNTDRWDRNILFVLCHGRFKCPATPTVGFHLLTLR